MNSNLLKLLVLILLPTFSISAESIFEEKGGIVAIEAETTDSRLGDWQKKTDVKDYSGECHLEFTGNKTVNGPPKSKLTYQFRINKAGKYQLSIRARKRLETERQDISNDCYVAVKGNYGEAGGAPLDILKEDTKMYGGNPDSWAWTRNLDANHKKFPAIYNFKKGETYELIIHGRSKNFNIDRFLFVHEDNNIKEVQRNNPPESKISATSTTQTANSRVKRTLQNKQGQSIEAQLVEIKGSNLIALVKGARYEIPLSSLSEADQQFLKDWQAN